MQPFLAGIPVAMVLVWATLAVFAVLETRQALRRRADATNMDRGSLLIVRLSVTAGVLLATLVLRVRATAFAYNLYVIGFGLGIIWAGMGLRWWSFHTLGRYFTFTVMTSADQSVITSGPYRALRHPSYAGILLLLTGVGIMLGNWLSLAALILLPLIGFMNRIRVEEAALSGTLGEAYTSYARGRKRMIPFLW